MYFNDNERKAINMLAKSRRISMADAERRYWAQMKDANPNEIERRQKEKRA